MSERLGGPSLTVDVGGERFGSCLRRLTPARLAGGWLPILETRYRGRSQESFAARVPEVGTLVSFVRVTGRGEIGFTPSVAGLRRRGNRLVRSGRTYATFSAGARWNGRSLVYAAAPAYVAWLDHPAAGTAFVLDAARYAEARSAVVGFWADSSPRARSSSSPSRASMNAERALLVQNLSSPGGTASATPTRSSRSPRASTARRCWPSSASSTSRGRSSGPRLTRRPTPYPSWKQGEKLLAAADVVRLSGDRELLIRRRRRCAATSPRSGGSSAAATSSRRSASPRTSPTAVHGLHAQAVVWQGLRRSPTCGRRRAALAGRACRRLARRLGPGLRRAVRASERRLPDGSLFLPMRLRGGEQPYASLTESRAGATGTWSRRTRSHPGSSRRASAEAKRALRYLLLHGSRLLGLVRAGGYALYGRDAPPPVSGTDQVTAQHSRGSSPPRTRPISSC